MDNLILTPVPLEVLLQSLRSVIKAGNYSDAAHPPEIIDTDTLCNRLNITKPTAIRYRKKGAIPFLRIGSSIRYDWNAVVKALENKKKGK